MSLFILAAIAAFAFFMFTRPKDTAQATGVALKSTGLFGLTVWTLGREYKQIHQETDGLILGNKGESVAAVVNRVSSTIDDSIGSKYIREQSLIRQGEASPVNKPTMSE